MQVYYRKQSYYILDVNRADGLDKSFPIGIDGMKCNPTILFNHAQTVSNSREWYD